MLDFYSFPFMFFANSWSELLSDSFNPFPNKPWFLRVCCTTLLKTLGKREIAHNEQFLLFPQCFLPFRRTFCYYQKEKKEKMKLSSATSFKLSLKFVVWERVNSLPNHKIVDLSKLKAFANRIAIALMMVSSLKE